MKKQNVINLVKYHVEKNNDAFVSEVVEIAKDFASSGDMAVAQYLMELISDTNFYVPQADYRNFRFLQETSYVSQPLYLPDSIAEDVIGITKAINNKTGLSKFLFYGKPGSGKTQSAYQIARLLDRDILTVSFEQLIDSRLGETAKNVSLLFDEINRITYNKTIVLFDEIDSLVLDRVNKNDVREMGRVTSVFLKEMEKLNENIVIIATTNLIENFDKALLRRFDTTISFDRYSRDDLIEVSDSLLNIYLKNAVNSRQDIRLFNKILRNLDTIPFPGDMKSIIKTAIAFSDESNEYDYLRKIYLSLNNNETEIDIAKLKSEGFTTREIEILSRIPKSSVSRRLREVK